MVVALGGLDALVALVAPALEREAAGRCTARSLASSASRLLEASPEFHRVVASLTSRDGPGGKSDASAREAVREGAASFANRRFRDALARLDDACRRARCPELVAEIHARRATAHLKLAQVEARASGPWTARRARSLDARLRAAARECDRALRTLDDDEASTAREPGPVERREPSSAGASRDRTRAAAYLRRGAARHALGDLERALEDVLSAEALLPLGSAASDAARTRADAIRRAKPSKTSKAAASKTSKAAPSAPPPASNAPSDSLAPLAERDRSPFVSASVEVRFRSSGIGFGVFATRALPAGAAVLVEAARASTHADARARRGRCGACFAALRLGECVACRGCAQRAYCAERCRDADARGAHGGGRECDDGGDGRRARDSPTIARDDSKRTNERDDERERLAASEDAGGAPRDEDEAAPAAEGRSSRGERVRRGRRGRAIRAGTWSTLLPREFALASRLMDAASEDEEDCDVEEKEKENEKDESLPEAAIRGGGEEAATARRPLPRARPRTWRDLCDGAARWDATAAEDRTRFAVAAATTARCRRGGYPNEEASPSDTSSSAVAGEAADVADATLRALANAFAIRRADRADAALADGGAFFPGSGPGSDFSDFSDFFAASFLELGVAPEPAATGVFLVASRINHSCRPNAHAVFDADLTATVRVVRRVAAGEEITVSYGPTTDSTPERAERRRRLGASHAFECACAACDDDGAERSDERSDAASNASNPSSDASDAARGEKKEEAAADAADEARAVFDDPSSDVADRRAALANLTLWHDAVAPGLRASRDRIRDRKHGDEGSSDAKTFRVDDARLLASLCDAKARGLLSVADAFRDRRRASSVERRASAYACAREATDALALACGCATAAGGEEGEASERGDGEEEEEEGEVGRRRCPPPLAIERARLAAAAAAAGARGDAAALARRAIAALRRVGTGAGVEGRALEVAEEVARWAELAWDR